MLPTFVIGLREGLEAALIVGIIAAFLRKQGRGDLVRQMALGVAAAVAICTAGGIALEIYSRDLPQRQQEGLETVIGALAVAMVTYMVVWMKGHSRGLKAELEAMAAGAIHERNRAGTAMVVMAFLAVLREGFETVVFLLAAFNEAGSGSSAVIGAVLGILVAVGLGYGIYRGGVRINLSKFFRATGLVLVLVAAGLVVTAVHTAHEAGWLQVGQQQLLDLSWLVRPGSVLSSLLTGILGVQPFPVVAEVLGWILYVVPVGLFVAWPPGRPVPWRSLRVGLAATAVAGIAGALLVHADAPSVDVPAPATTSGSISAHVVRDHGRLVLVTVSQSPLTGRSGTSTAYPLGAGRSVDVRGVPATRYRIAVSSTTRTARLSTTVVASHNGDRMPLGVVPDGHDRVRASVTDSRVLTASVEPRTLRVLTVQWSQQRRASVIGSSHQVVPLSSPLAVERVALPAATTTSASRAAAHDLGVLAARGKRDAEAWLAAILGLAALLGLGVSFAPRRRDRGGAEAPARQLIRT